MDQSEATFKFSLKMIGRDCPPDPGSGRKGKVGDGVGREKQAARLAEAGARTPMPALGMGRQIPQKPGLGRAWWSPASMNLS